MCIFVIMLFFFIIIIIYVHFGKCFCNIVYLVLSNLVKSVAHQLTMTKGRHNKQGFSLHLFR